MTRGIVAAALVRPVWEASGLRVEGPDEDAFTLAVAAIEELGLPPAELAHLERVDLVGEFPPEVDWGIGEALGVDNVAVHHHHEGVPSFYGALASAAASPPSGSGLSVVVGVDLATRGREPPQPRQAACAVAVLLKEGPGSRVVGLTSRNHPPERRPDASAWVRQAHKAAPEISRDSRGILGVIAEAPPPVLLHEWQTTFPSLVPVVRPWELPEWGHLGSCRGALALHEHLQAAPSGEFVCIAAIRKERTDFLALRRDAEPTWHGDWSEAGAALPTPNDRPFALAVDLEAVSEGAYVPRPRYVENLPSRWRFAAEECGGCGKVTFPRRGYCRHCRRTEGLQRVELPREGLTVEAVTTVAPGAQPTEFDPQVAASGSYSVALVDLTRGARATLQVSDAPRGSLRVGDRVATRLRRLYPMEGAWRYGRKAVPLLPRS
ncbi:MAG TPA: hypothetical protein VFG07_02155 [Thermoplasmata archaeon]|nr:hypothetical protein [Thermoplasmata archaeon]